VIAPRHVRVLVLIVAAALAGVPGWAPAADPAAPEGPRIGGHFKLLAADGTAVTDRSFPGEWLLIYFGYTFCPDACPTALTTIAAALHELGPLANRIQPIFITVDPQRDTAPVLARYVKAFDPRLLGVTGSDTQIATIAQGFHVCYKVRSLGNEEYTIDHSSYIYLVDPAGRVVKLITGESATHPLASELKRLIE